MRQGREIVAWDYSFLPVKIQTVLGWASFRNRLTWRSVAK
jgi:hypothetical protein